MLLNQKLTNPDSLTGSIPADPAVQADAAARHRGDVARRVVGLVRFVVLPQRLRPKEHLRSRPR